MLWVPVHKLGGNGEVITQSVTYDMLYSRLVKYLWLLGTMKSERVISNFNGTSTPKGSYSAKTGLNC